MGASDSDINLDDKIRALREPAAYPAPCPSVEAIETHFSCVFLAGEFAYKLKKPVHIERMDFRSLAAREKNCRDELQLNRRLAPQVYLQVVPLCMDDSGRIRVGGSGVAIDWLVKMRRLPAQRMLNSAMDQQALIPIEISPVAKLLAEFYRTQLPVTMSGRQYSARLHTHAEDSYEQLLATDLHLNADTIELAIAQQRSFLATHAAMVESRATAGKIVEGHGDLRPEHIFLGSERGDAVVLAPCIIDCLEFDHDLRIFDPLEELAFLSLECGRLDAAWVSAEFVRVYREVTLDAFDAQLFDFYRAERALNRAKIAAWHLRDPKVRDLADWRALAESYLRNALDAG